MKSQRSQRLSAATRCPSQSKGSIHQNNLSYFQENTDPNTYSRNSIFEGIQDIERQYQKRIDDLTKLNSKLLQTVEYLQNSLNETKQMLQSKQQQISRQINEIADLRFLLQQHACLNIKSLKTEIDDEKQKTERLRKELEQFKCKFECEQPMTQLVRRFEKSQEAHTQKNKQFLEQVMQMLEAPTQAKPRSLSSYRPKSMSKHCI